MVTAFFGAEECLMLKKVGKVLVALIPVGLPGVAFAEVDTAVSTALTTAATDSATVAGLVLAAIVGIFAFKLMRKAL